jgi:hypothetical protein
MPGVFVFWIFYLIEFWKFGRKCAKTAKEGPKSAFFRESKFRKVTEFNFMRKTVEKLLFLCLKALLFSVY